MPNERFALRAKHDKVTVYLARRVAKKIYRCPGCGGQVGVGEVHVVARRLLVTRGGAHRHWHFGCVHRVLVPELSGMSVVDAREAEPSLLNAKARRKRSVARRRLR